MNKYILLAVLALAFTAPSFAYAQDAAPAAEKDGKAKKHAAKKEHKKSGKKHRAVKAKAKTEAAPAAAPAVTGGNK